LLALVPVWVPMVDSVIGSQTSAVVTPSFGQGVQVLIPSVMSYQGSDRLEVMPGAVLAEPNSTVEVVIRVYFKHAQPCPYNDWSISYHPSGDIRVISDDGGRLIDVKTYERVLEVDVLGNGTLTVTYDYGTCPEGDKEVVTVDFYVGSAPAGLTPVTGTPVTTYTETPEYGSESSTYVNVSGVVMSVDPYAGTLTVNGTVIYVRGEFYDPVTEEELEYEEVLSLIHVGDNVTVVCKVTGSGRYMAEEIILPDGTVLSKG